MNKNLGLDRVKNNVKKGKEALEDTFNNEEDYEISSFEEVLINNGIKREDFDDYLAEKRKFFKKVFYIYLVALLIVLVSAIHYISTDSLFSTAISFFIAIILFIKMFEASFRCFQIDERSLRLSFKDLFKSGRIIP